MGVSYLGDTFHAWVGVEHDGVRWVSVCGEDLFLVRRPLDSANLRWGLLCMDARSSVDVPYMY